MKLSNLNLLTSRPRYKNSRQIGDVFPAVDFHLEIGLDREIEKGLEENKIDIGFMLYTQNKRLFHREAVYRQPITPVVSRLFLTKNKLPRNIEATLDYPLVDYVSEYSSYTTWIRKNAPHLLPLAVKKNPKVTMTNSVGLKNMVLQGMGIGFLQQELIQSEIDTAELVTILAHVNHKPISAEIDMALKRNIP